MSMMGWTATEFPGYLMYATEVIPEYEIKKLGDDKFYVVRTVAECDDIGPLKTFDEAENAVMLMGRMLMGFEEQAWRHVAAVTLQAAGLLAAVKQPVKGTHEQLAEFMQGVVLPPGKAPIEEPTL